ncbi:helix-turn-helix domain-containing protein [Nonomuraea sp. NPDC026600]
MHAIGEYTIADLMKVFSIGRATVYRVLDRAPGWLDEKLEDQAVS